MERGPRNPSSSSRSTATSSRPATARINLGDARAPDWKASGGRRMRTITQKQKQKQKQSLTIKEQGRGHEQDEEEEGEDEEQPNVLIGTCPFMCPEGERSQRERLRDLSVFERLHGNPGKTSPGLAIKKFCRTISSKSVQASDVRPPPILEETLTYLLSFLDSIDHDFEVIHDFIFDRTRSIRQDLVMQNITNHKAIVMYEKMVKFHVISHLKLRHCSNTPSILSVHYLNMEQLIKTLTSLYGLYDANRDSTSFYKNEAEFRSLYVLLHLNPTSRVTRELLSLWLCHVPLSVIKSKEMCFARSILRFLWIGNFKRFFCTIATEATYLQYCIIEPFINEVRAMYLSCINNVGYKLHPYPVTCLSKLMRMKELDVVFLCNACGLHTSADEGGNKLLPTKQTTFCSPKGGFQNYKFLGLEKFES